MTVHYLPMSPRAGLELARRVVRSKDADRESLSAAIAVLAESRDDIDRSLAAELRKVGYVPRDPLALIATSICAAWLVALIAGTAIESYWTAANAVELAGVM